MLTTQENGPELTRIAPPAGSRYSPNFYQWLQKYMRARRRGHPHVYVDDKGVLWIGAIDNDNDEHGGGWLTGTRLISVLCNGARQGTMAYAIKSNFASLTEITDFWARYMRDGRCAIDPDHKQLFVGDETRWAEDGDERHCLWCGQHTQVLRRRQEIVERHNWESAPRSSSRSSDATANAPSEASEP